MNIKNNNWQKLFNKAILVNYIIIHYQSLLKEIEKNVFYI